MSKNQTKKWLVLICGFCGSMKAYQWLACKIERLGFKVLIVESLRFGLPKGFVPSDYDCLPEVALQVHHVRNRMQAKGIDKAVIVGHSFGGLVGAMFAKHYSDRVDKLVLASSAGLQITGLAQAWTFISSTYGDIVSALSRKNMHLSAAKWFGLIKSPGYLANLHRARKEIEALNYYTLDRFVPLCQQINKKTPVRVIVGAQDRLMSPQARQILADAGIYSQIVEGMGHDFHCHDKAPNALNQALELTA